MNQPNALTPPMETVALPDAGLRLVLVDRSPSRAIADCFRRETYGLPVLKPCQLLLRTHLASIDICARGRMCGNGDDRLELGEVMPCATVSRVQASRHPAFRVGDFVLAQSGWQTHEVVDGDQVVRKLYPKVAPVGTALGIYGLYGYIAWEAVREVCRPARGQTAVVAAAAGPIGATAAQLLQAAGVRVVAVTSGEKKCAHVRDTFAPAAVLDREASDFQGQLRAACPDGVDILVENVDLRCLDPVMPLLNVGARIPLCGLIEDERMAAAQVDRLPGFLNAILERQLQVQAFTRRDLGRLHSHILADPHFMSEIGLLLRNGQLRWHEELLTGLEALPEGLERLVRGDNLGKVLVQLD
jgi:NADPH-dependent curcumin reductase CurA